MDTSIFVGWDVMWARQLGQGCGLFGCRQGRSEDSLGRNRLRNGQTVQCTCGRVQCTRGSRQTVQCTRRNWFQSLVETDRRFSALVGGGNAFGFAVGLLLGRRSCTVGAAGLAITRVRTVCRGGGSSICLMKGLNGALLCWLLAWTVMSSAISSSSLSGVSSSKITNGLLLHMCR
jgi:hypothetical protein